MTMINMLRGGATNGPKGNQYTQNMYPRPDYKVSQMSKNDGWENRPDSFHYVERFDLCQCFNTGAIERAKEADATTTECALEVGDVIPLVWVNNRSSVLGITIDIVDGMEGAVFGVQSRHFTSDMGIVSGIVTPTLEITGVDATPLPVGTVPIDQPYLDSFKCGDRIELEEFCQCKGRGVYAETALAAPLLVGGGNALEAGYTLDLVVEALPADMVCPEGCLTIDVGARVRVPRAGN